MKTIVRLNFDNAQWGLSLQRKDGQPDKRFDKPPQGFSLTFIRAFITKPQELVWNKRPPVGLRSECTAYQGAYLLTVVFPANHNFFTSEAVVGQFLDIFDRSDAIVKDAHEETIDVKQLESIIHKAAVSLANHNSKEFRLVDGELNTAAIRQHLLKTAGIVSNLEIPEDQEIARFIEGYEDELKIALIDKVLAVY